MASLLYVAILVTGSLIWRKSIHPVALGLTLPAFIFPAFIRTDLNRHGPNSALSPSAEKREKLRKLA